MIRETLTPLILSPRQTIGELIAKGIDFDEIRYNPTTRRFFGVRYEADETAPAFLRKQA